jgi:glycosyltransferase involved in cell wall biosynthesis
VVATAVGGLAETVEDGVTGRLVPPRDPGAIAQALSALRSPGVRQPLARAARRRARGYGWDRVARATETALARIAALAAEPAETPA